jgi:hypothetical protein
MYLSIVISYKSNCVVQEMLSNPIVLVVPTADSRHLESETMLHRDSKCPSAHKSASASARARGKQKYVIETYTEQSASMSLQSNAVMVRAI